MIIFLITLGCPLAHALDLGEIDVFDHQTLSQAHNCILVDKQICMLPLELMCDNTLVAEIKACTSSLNIFKKAKESDFAYSVLIEFMKSEGFKVDQSYKLVRAYLSQVHFLAFTKD